MISLLPSFAIGYAFGSIPTALLIVQKARGIDIRSAGSGNVGAMNSFLVTRSVLVGISVFVIDVVKGLAPVSIVRAWFGTDFPLEGAAGLGAVVGHNYSVWLKGRGGRGLATAAGAMMTIVPIFIPLWMLSWVLGFAFVREVNVGNALACLLATLVLVLFPAGLLHVGRVTPLPFTETIIFVAVTMAVILTRLVIPVRDYLHSQRRL